MESPDQHVSLRELLMDDDSSMNGSELSLLHASSGSDLVARDKDDIDQDKNYYQEELNANPSNEIIHHQIDRLSLELSDTTVQGDALVEFEEQLNAHLKRYDDEAAHSPDLNEEALNEHNNDDNDHDSEVGDIDYEHYGENDGDLSEDLALQLTADEYIDFGASDTPPHQAVSIEDSLSFQDFKGESTLDEQSKSLRRSSIDNYRKVSVIVRVRPCEKINSIDPFSSLCLFPPSSNEAANSINNDSFGDFKGDIIAVNPKAFGSSQFPNSHMALNVARSVAEIVSGLHSFTKIHKLLIFYLLLL